MTTPTLYKPTELRGTRPSVSSNRQELWIAVRHDRAAALLGDWVLGLLDRSSLLLPQAAGWKVTVISTTAGRGDRLAACTVQVPAR